MKHMHDENELAYCGIWCPECSFRTAYETGKRLHLEKMPSKYDRFKSKELPDCACTGCKRDDACGDCDMKDCASARNLAHCGDCPNYPCEKTAAFQGDGIPHHAQAGRNLDLIRVKGLDAFIAEVETKRLCLCGERLSWYVDICPSCGKERNAG